MDLSTMLSTAGHVVVRMVLGCQHDHCLKERVEGVLTLTCDTCGKSWPAINRSVVERRTLLDGAEFGAAVTQSFEVSVDLPPSPPLPTNHEMHLPLAKK